MLTLSSGVKGFTTIHAGSARQALTRLRFICQLADTSNELPMSALSALVSEAIDIVVHCTRIGGMVRVSEVIAVEESQTGPDATQFTVTELFARPAVDEPLAWTGNLPVRAARALTEAGFDVRSLLDPDADRRGGSGSRSSGRVVTGQRRPAPCGGDRRLMAAVLVAVAGAAGVFLLYTSVVLGWSGLGVGPASTTRRHRPHRAQQWLAQAGLDDVQPSEFLWVMALLFVLGTGLTFALFGSPLPAVAVGAFAATYPVASYRPAGAADAGAAAEAWPRMIEEIALLTGSLGRSVPQALFEVGRRGPDEMRAAFEAATRHWLVTTDFPASLSVLKAGLADATADAACETLLVAHEVGGSDVQRRLAALVEDRTADVQGRKDAAARQAGVRFARRFVLFVPIGMALTGLSIGDGRAAYSTGVRPARGSGRGGDGRGLLAVVGAPAAPARGGPGVR